jgi:O-antigen ligase
VKQILSEEKSIFIAPFFIILYVLSVPVSSSLKSIMAVLSLAAVVLTPYYRKHLWDAFNTIWARAAIVFFAYVVLASLWADSPFSMRLIVIDKYSKLIYLPILAVGFINPKTRQWAFNAYFAIMLVTCVLSLLKHLDFLSINNIGDSGEIFHNHIATGFMVALAVYFAGILSFNANISKWQRAYYLFMMVAGSYQVFFLNTGRTGYIIYGLLMSLLIIQKFSFKKAILGCVLFCGFIGLIYTLSPLMQLRTSLLINDIKFLQQHEENTSLGFRVQFHEYARSLFERSPIIGLGTGSFKYHYAQEQPIPSWDRKLNDPHSQYWLTLVEQGLVGMALLIAFLGSLFITALRLNKENRPMVIGLLAAFCLGSFSDSILCFSTAGTLLIIFCALCFSELLEKKAYKEVADSEAHGSPELAV